LFRRRPVYGALFRGQEFIHQDVTVMAAVVVFVLDADAAARELDFARDDDVVIMVFEVFPVAELAARGGLTLEVAVCVHA